MIPTFFELKSKTQIDNRCLFFVNSIQLKPSSVEKYHIVLTEEVGEIQQLSIYNKETLVLIIEGYSVLDIEGSRVIELDTSTWNIDSWDLLHFRLTDQYEQYISNVFRCSSDEIELTTYIEYTGHTWEGNYMGVRLNLYERHSQRAHEVTAYYEVQKRTQVTANSKYRKMYKYQSEFVSIEVLNSLLDVFTLPKVYINGFRSYIYEMPEVEDTQADEDFSSITFSVSREPKDFREYRLTVWGFADGVIVNENNNTIKTE